MVELHTEALERRERLDTSLLDVSMANRAKRAARVGELLRVTTGTWHVPRTFRPRSATLATVTQEAWKSFVRWLEMRKLGKI